jgi:hypothetical protein
MSQPGKKRTLVALSSMIAMAVIVICFLPVLLDEDGASTNKSLLERLFQFNSINDGESYLNLEKNNSKVWPRRGSSTTIAGSTGKEKSGLAHSSNPAFQEIAGSSDSKSAKNRGGPGAGAIVIGAGTRSFQQGAPTKTSKKTLSRTARKSAKTGSNSSKGSSSNAVQGELDSPDNQESTNSSKDEDEEQEEDKETPYLGPTATTQLSGKIMSHNNRKGLGSASVQCLVFYPLSTVPGAPVWVVAIPATTDANGNFQVLAELPQTPGAGPTLGLLVSHKNHKAAAGVPIGNVVPGNDSNLGVFWLGQTELSLQGSIAPADASTTSSLVDTGGLNPLSWDLRVRDNMLSLFPIYKPTEAEFNMTVGGQGVEYDNQRWMTLYSGGHWLGSRSVIFQEIEIEVDGDLRKEAIGTVKFILGPDTALRGRVAAKNGGALPGAVVTAIGSTTEPTQSEISGPNGDFSFAKPSGSLSAFKVEHKDYLTQDFLHDPVNLNPEFLLEKPRPDIPILLLDEMTDSPIESVRVLIIGPQIKGQVTKTQQLNLSSATGDYRLSAAFPIDTIRFEGAGYFLKELQSPDNKPASAITVKMNAGRFIHLTARESKARSGASNEPSRGTYWWDHFDSSLLAWSQNNWLEFELDYGVELSAFDLEIGVRNHRIIDHKYHFEIRVSMEDMTAKDISILASQETTQSGRVALPPRKGTQIIRVTWRNDRYIPGQLDANIVIDWVKFHERELTAEERAQQSP